MTLSTLIDLDTLRAEPLTTGNYFSESVEEQCRSIVGKLKEMAVDKLEKIRKPSCGLSHVGIKDVNRKNVTMASILSVKNPCDHNLPIVTITYKSLSADRLWESPSERVVPTSVASARKNWTRARWKERKIVAKPRIPVANDLWVPFVLMRKGGPIFLYPWYRTVPMGLMLLAPLIVTES